MNRKVSPPTPWALVRRNALLSGSFNMTFPYEHVGASVGLATGATTTGGLVGTTDGLATTARVGARVGTVVVLGSAVGSSGKMVGSGVVVTGT